MVSPLPPFVLLFAACLSVSALSSKRGSSVCTEIRDRVPWSQLTQEEKTTYIQADLCLINAPSKSRIRGAVTRWDDLQWPHVVQTITVHNVGAFLPFHRYYMTAHERLIRDECGYTGRMPYWDELKDINNLTASELWSPEYFGGNGVGPQRCVQDGPFSNLTLRWIQNGSTSDHCLSRVFNNRALQSTSQVNIDECNNITNYTSAWECWSLGPHGGGHGGVGGIMSDGTLSPGDPVFYLHHSWLDKLWWEWQKINSLARLTDMGGPNIPRNVSGFPGGGNGSFPGFPTNGSFPEFPPVVVGREFTDYFGDGGSNVTTLNHTLWMTEIYPNQTIGDIMDLNGPIICSEYLNF